VHIWLIVIIALLIVLPGMFQEEEAAAALFDYCEMVDAYNQTGGDFGWPDYENKFDKECLEWIK